MLENIMQFFETLFSPILAIFDVVNTFFNDLVYVISLLTSFVMQIPDMLSFLPTATVPILIIIFDIVVIYKILGREG